MLYALSGLFSVPIWEAEIIYLHILGKRPHFASLSCMLFAVAEAISYPLQQSKIPSDLIQMLPYLATIIGLVVYSVRKAANDKKRRQMLAEK